MGYTDCKLASLVSKGVDKARGLDHFVASTRRQKEDIFKLRYDAYTAESLVPENEKAVLSDQHDHDGSASIMGVTLQGELVSTIRLGVLSRRQRDCVTYSVFKDHLDPIIENGEKIAEGSRLAVRCGNSAVRRGVILYTLGLAASFAASVGADRGAMFVRPAHAPFYKRYGFDLVSGPRPYALTELSLMMIRLRASRERSFPLRAAAVRLPYEGQPFRMPTPGFSPVQQMAYAG
jgi:predicted transcriptional regulator with HTH domain